MIDWVQLFTDICITIVRVLVASLTAWLLAIIFGIVLSKHKKSYTIVLPLVNFLRQISPFAWMPFAIMLFGLGELPIAVVLVSAMFFPAIVMVYEVFLAFPKDIHEEAITSGAHGLNLFFHIELPICKKQLINVYRILWSVGWSTVIAAEMLGVSNGLGFRLLDCRYLLNYRQMWFYLIIIGIIGIITDHVIKFFTIEKT